MLSQTSIVNCNVMCFHVSMFLNSNGLLLIATYLSLLGGMSSYVLMGPTHIDGLISMRHGKFISLVEEKLKKGN